MAALASCAGGMQDGPDEIITKAMYYVDVATVLGLPAEVSHALCSAIEGLLKVRGLVASSSEASAMETPGNSAWPAVGHAPAMLGPAVESLEADALTSAFFDRRYLSKEPVAIRNLAHDWPAVKDFAGVEGLRRLVKQHGHRTVPIELRDKEERLTEKLMLLREFVEQRLLSASADGETAYLAQHDLFAQIPALKDGIKTPVYCGNELSVVNAWLGTGGTVTRAHYDSYDNIFVQLTGRKYVRLIAPDQGHLMYRVTRNSKKPVKRARLDSAGTSAHGASTAAEEVAEANDELAQGNMSAVPNLETYDREKFPLLAEAAYSEVVLDAGDALYIPAGHWHYVRSLSTSFSVSFWF
eukprot:TRINITY_DN9626_c1_g1_i1.p1 TRINITY_DN9626_c1_g1~~TRINITY_DN9626_c1_g1_i1.p1  ORF type:complete len:354 (-),score=60.55 TRINITY_DN9626_c1_g1_i1:39-1100(-)